MDYRFVIADVFTTSPFGGNQLAVFPNAEGLSTTAMQALTREFNFAESTFVLPTDDPRCTHRLRIFTPGREMPFAGHPTVGTAAVLARLGLTDLHDGRAPIVFEEGVGPVAVAVQVEDGATQARLTLERGSTQPAQEPDRAAAAATLSLPVDAVRDAWFAEAGVPFCFVHLTDVAAVDRAVLDQAAWATHFASAWAPQIWFFAGETAPGARLYARMFAPALGVAEDPATGAASAALAGVLADRWEGADGAFDWTIDQGVAMGRPSIIEITAEKRAGVVTTIQVGGSVVVMGEGVMSVPEGY